MVPSEFRNNTYKEIKTYVEARGMKEKNDLKAKITILDVLGTKIIMGHPLIKKNKIITLQDEFKELFKKNNAYEQSPEEMAEILRSWKNGSD